MRGRAGGLGLVVAALMLACGPLDEGRGPPGPLGGAPSPRVVGENCSVGYPGGDEFCDCKEYCGPEIHLLRRCEESYEPRPDGSPCTAGAFAQTGVCVQGRCCAADVASTCADGLACTLDVCVPGTFDCDHPIACAAVPNECYPGSCSSEGGCANDYLGDGAPCSAGVCWEQSCQAGCWIENAFRTAGLDPADDCRACDVGASRTAWTPLAEGTPCGTGADQFCASNACRTGCFIDGAFYAPGGAKPGEECWICDVATPTAWTASFGRCRADGVHCTDDRCGGDGVCHHDPIPGCVPPEETSSLYGCSSGGAGAGLLLGSLALWPLARRRSRRTTSGAAGRIVLGALLASAPLVAGAAEGAPARGRPGKGATLAVLAFKAGPGVEPETAALVTRTFTAAVQGRTGFEVLTTADVLAVLDFEQQKAALGCSAEECLAEMGGALGVEWILSGALGRIGGALAFDAQLVDIRSGVALRRFATTARAATDEGFLDLIPPAVAALFPAEGTAPRFALSVRGEGELRTPLAGAGAVLFEARLGGVLRAGGGLLATPSRLGALGRLAWLPWRPAASLHPVVALELTAFAADGLALGVGLNPGLEWAPRRELALLLEVPLQLFLAAPARTRTTYALAAASAAWRF